MPEKLPFFLRIPLVKKIRRLWAKQIFEVSAGCVVFYFSKEMSDPEFLLIERGHPFKDWVFPKGKVKLGEEIRQTALRETKEETGLSVNLFDEITSYSYTYFWDPTNEKGTKTVHYFLARTDSNIPNFEYQPDTGNEGESFKQVKFFKASDAIALVKHQVEKDTILKAQGIILSNLNLYQA